MNKETIPGTIVKVSKCYLIIMGCIIIGIGIWQSLIYKTDEFIFLTGFVGIESIVVGILIKVPRSPPRDQ